MVCMLDACAIRTKSPEYIMVYTINPESANHNKGGLLLSSEFFRSLYDKQCGPLSDCSYMGPHCLLLYLN